MSRMPAPPVAPMLARPLAAKVPQQGPKGQELAFEPKWDGFRCLLFVPPNDPLAEVAEVWVQSRSGENLAYCFPEIARAAGDLPPGTVLDGELVIANAGRLWFERLGERIRPRSEAGGWKINKLAEQYPASFVAFDLLATAGEEMLADPYRQRRQALERLPLAAPFYRSPATSDPKLATQWFTEFEGAGLDGVIAKPVDDPYSPGKRAVFKIKHARTADVVVAGWRPHKQPGPEGQPVVGSLLLGLYDDSGLLHHVGVASSFSVAKRIELTALLATYTANEGDDHPWLAAEANVRRPGGPSRWSAGKDLSFIPVRPALVAEVGYDHMEGGRFRHTTKLLRFRPDRTPASCRYDQLEQPVGYQLDQIVPGLG